jgi:MYXO-CTERM domain-containing protein
MNRLFKNIRTLLPIAAFVLVTAFALPANAAQQTFDLVWTGDNGSPAIANGVITFDPTLITKSFSIQDITSNVTNFSITITGASSGNGTFGLSDFNKFTIDTDNTNLDFTKQLIGQPTASGTWGGPIGGDFGIFSNGSDPAAPESDANFTIGTESGVGDFLDLTSFLPAVTSAPEPSSEAVIAIGALGVGGLALVRRRKAVNNVN